MKIAIFHNFMDNIGGAEIATLYLARGLGADLYTTNIDRKKITKMGFDADHVYSIGRVPVSAPWRHEATYWRFRQLNLGGRYDLYIISGDWALAAAVNHQPNLWYIFSPMRELWDLAQYTRNTIVPWYGRPIFDQWVQFHRYFAHRHVTSVNQFISISKNVQDRVSKFLYQDSSIIYPPVDTKQYQYIENGDFWLSVNRLISHKRVMLQLDAFRALPEEKLVIVGSYEQSSHFKNYAAMVHRYRPQNVSVISWVDQSQLIDLYARCKGFITTALDEDFGLTAVEAMASGKPVIAPNEGGYRETVLDGVTGTLINQVLVEKLVAAICHIGQNPGCYRQACEQRAEVFSLPNFIAKIKKVID